MVLVVKEAGSQLNSIASSSDSDSDPELAVAAAVAANFPPSQALASVPPAAAGGAQVSPAAAVLVLLSGEVRVDEGAVADHLGLPRRRLRLASRQEAVALTGYEVGSIPPFGECSNAVLAMQAIGQQHN